MINFMFLRRVKVLRVVINFEKRNSSEDKDAFKQFSTVYFRNPRSYAYTVKETGEQLTNWLSKIAMGAH